MTQPFLSPRFHYSFGPHDPAVTLRDSQTLELICPDSDNRLSDGGVLADPQRGPIDAPPGIACNPLAGPIAVEAARPGDALAVTIHRITLDRADGQTLLKPDHGLVRSALLESAEAHDPVPHHLYQWRLDNARGEATLDNPRGDRTIRVKLAPFVGCIGVCPRRGRRIHTLFAGPHGGNMDLPLIAPGTTIHFPVHHPGALLMLGDLHAAQGHGEIIGGAIETSGRVACSVRLIPHHPLDAIRLESPAFLAAIGHHDDLRAAIEAAYAALLNFVVERTGLNRWDAYQLIAQTGRVVLGGLIHPPFTAAACVDRQVLAAQGVGS